MEERLHKLLAQRGLASRRAVEVMIADGRVKVNGEIVDTMGLKVNPELDKITVDDIPIDTDPGFVYIMLYKPSGYLCTVADPKGRRTVLDLVEEATAERIYPVGRLDYNTSGLLLLTNDGELTNWLLHPGREINKTYQAKVNGIVTEEKLVRLRKGIYLREGMTSPAQARVLRQEDDWSIVEVTIHEGRNRQVRRMLDAVECPVVWLKRTGFANLTLDGLSIGKWRYLNGEEVRKLQDLANKKEVKTAQRAEKYKNIAHD